MDLLDPREQVPWITFGAQAWLEGYLQPDMAVFEWGSGGSTLYFARRVRRVVSVEHNPDWHRDVQAALASSGVANCEYLLRVPRRCRFARYLPYNGCTYVSRTFAEHRDLTFRAYARQIAACPDRSFDLVVVDGRVRAACLRLAWRKIKPGGFLLLDNAERPSYQPAMARLARFARQDFCGRGPRLVEEWQTTVWQIR
ncbi:MAG: class I SAM-dependent methyltransferase [Kiritimatiellia bacterium]